MPGIDVRRRGLLIFCCSLKCQSPSQHEVGGEIPDHVGGEGVQRNRLIGPRQRPSESGRQHQRRSGGDECKRREPTGACADGEGERDGEGGAGVDAGSEGASEQDDEIAATAGSIGELVGKLIQKEEVEGHEVGWQRSGDGSIDGGQCEHI